jgi:hypothetical protein
MGTVFNPSFPPNAKSLIQKLVVNNSQLRLGMLRNGVDDIWTHPFFSGIKLLYLHCPFKYSASSAAGITKELVESKALEPPYM